MNYPQVRYYITTPLQSRLLLKSPPLDWDDDNKSLQRGQESWGVFSVYGESLTFVKEAKDIIRATKEQLSTEAEILLERWIYVDIERGYELDYKGFLDLKTYSFKDEKVTIKFGEGGLKRLVDSQFDESYELERQTDIEGNEITPIDYETIYWEGRRLFLQALIKKPEQADPFLILQDFFGQGGNYAALVNFTGTVDYNGGFEDDLLIPSSVLSFTLNQPNPDTTRRPEINNFIFLASRDRTVNFKFDWSFTINNFFAPANAITALTLNLVVRVYNFDRQSGEFIDLAYGEELDLFVTVGGDSGNSIDEFIGNNYSGTNEITLDLLEDQIVFFGLGTTAVGVAGQNAGGSGFIQWQFSNANANIEIKEDSLFEPTEFNALKLYGAFERNLEILTGERNKFKSDYFNTGEFRNVLITSGKHIRNIDNAKITLELKDLYETNNYFNLGWSIETVNDKEIFVVEDKDYFFVPFPLIDLGEVAELEISTASDHLFKSATFGNAKAGKYEELQGLQEYNAQTNYKTPLFTAENEYEVEGSVRADLVGAELARRKNQSVAPTEDTRYDEDNFLFDSKIYQSTKYTPKVWQDSLAEAPICYDPPTAGNLLLTPFRSMQRHASIFGAGLTKSTDKKVRYGSGTGATDVATRLAGEQLRFENGDILISELQNPYFQAEKYTFNRPLDIELKRLLRGRTEYLGRSIPNRNFMIKFEYKTVTYYGYLLEVGFNNPGEWQLIKANYNV